MNAIQAMKQETTVPVVITDEQGFISYVNDCFTKVFDWNLIEIQGQMITIIIPTAFHDPHHLGFSRFLLTGKSTILNHPIHLQAITKDGREIESEHTIIAEQENDRWVFVATLKPL